jgi:hypothetical protein
MKISIVIFSWILFGCNNVELNELNSFVSKLPTDSILSISTYDGSNQIVHPDVIFKNNKLILAITPYPNYNDSLENPCLYTSNNGLVFHEYLAKINPLVNTPKMDHNSDPDIMYDKKGNLVLFYLETMRPFTNKVISLTQIGKSKKFRKRIVLFHDLTKKKDLILSPALANLNDQHFMFFVNCSLKKNRIQYVASKNLTKFDSKRTKKVKISFPVNYKPWHLDVITGNDKYYLLVNGFYGEQNADLYSLFIAESNDLIHWTKNHEILTETNVPDKDLGYIYRATGLVTKDTIALWYSYATKQGTWKLAVKKLKL